MIVFDKKNIRISKPEDIAKILQAILKSEDKIDQDKEHFYAIHLNSRNIIKLIELVSLGTLDSGLIGPRETFRRAVIEGIAQIMVAHNHPSGETDPSEADIIITRKLEEAGKILDIELLDHIIFTADSFLSMKEERIL